MKNPYFRCNMFSHALVPYQKALHVFATKALETLTVAASKLLKVEPYDFSAVTGLAESPKSKKADADEGEGAHNEKRLGISELFSRATIQRRQRPKHLLQCGVFR